MVDVRAPARTLASYLSFIAEPTSATFTRSGFPVKEHPNMSDRKLGKLTKHSGPDNEK
jgi:hypothetical protein